MANGVHVPTATLSSPSVHDMATFPVIFELVIVTLPQRTLTHW